MRAATVILVAAAVLGGCHSNAAPPRAALDCPSNMGGVLRLASAAADGEACAYEGANGFSMTLVRSPVQHDVAATLEPFEQLVLAGRPDEPITRLRVYAPGLVEVAAADGGESYALPVRSHLFMRDGENNVRMGPVRLAPAGGPGITRHQDTVTLKGPGPKTKRQGVIRGMTHRGDHAEGYRVLGYEAAGPVSGPLTVAVIRSRDAAQFDAIQGEIRRLVRRNGGA